MWWRQNDGYGPHFYPNQILIITGVYEHLMKIKHINLALYAVGTRIYIEFIGRLMVAEVIALVSVPFIKVGKLIKQHPGLKIILGSLLVLLFSQILSDFINDSDSSDYLRGWAVILFSMISTIFLVKNLSGNSNGVVYYLFSLLVINLFIGEGDIDLSIWQEKTNYFKQRFVGFLNPAIILMGCYLFKLNQMKMVLTLFILYFIICFVFDARSNGLVFFISSALLYIKTSNIRLSGATGVGISIILLTLSYLAYIFYVDQVLNHGFGGNNSKQQLAAATNPYNPFELLYYGRTDFFVLIEAIADKPIFGHGSWGKDPSGQYTSSGLLGQNDLEESTRGFISAHSVFLGTWAYAGFFGFAATLYMYMFIFRLIFKVYQSKINSIYLPILIVTSVEMLWAYFFSPIQALRTSFPFFAALALTEFSKIKNNQRFPLTYLPSKAYG